MSLIALSVNHHRADVNLREQVAFDAARATHWLSELQRQGWQDVVLLSTCNRTEIYAELPGSPQPLVNDVRHQQLIEQFARASHLQPQQLQPFLYTHHDHAAMHHLIRVASGLDSQMLGEPQILGQLKHAVHLADQLALLSARFKRYFDYAFFAAKRVRSETAVGEHAVSLGYAVTQLAGQVFDDPAQLTALLVATGEMNTLVARHLAERGVGRLLLCNRTRSRAEELAASLPRHVHPEVIDFEDLPEALVQADLVSSCTGSLQQVIGYDMVRQALRKRRYEPMLLVDLAVPRDIDPEVARLDGIYLYGIDDLQRVIENNLSQRRQAAVEAEQLVHQLASGFAIQQKVQQAGSSIEHYRQHADHYRELEMQHALQQLRQGLPAEQVLEQLSKRLTNKLLHVPSRLLREAAIAEDPQYYQWLQHTLTDIHAGVRGYPSDRTEPTGLK